MSDCPLSFGIVLCPVCVSVLPFRIVFFANAGHGVCREKILSRSCDSFFTQFVSYILYEKLLDSNGRLLALATQRQKYVSLVLHV